jgi:hypothetical protein
MKTIEEIALAKEKRTTYMREYKRKQYALNKDQLNANQIMYYHKRHNPDIVVQDLKDFTVMKSEFTKILCNMQKIKLQHPEILKEYLQKYILDM